MVSDSKSDLLVSNNKSDDSDTRAPGSGLEGEVTQPILGGYGNLSYMVEKKLFQAIPMRGMRAFE
jgi:hypothetical protein